EAVEQYRAALELASNAPVILNNLAWMLATHPDATIRNSEEAVRLATRACELTGHKEPMFIGTLAAAYAEAGRFDDAVRTGNEAADLAESLRQTDLAATNRKLVT